MLEDEDNKAVRSRSSSSISCVNAAEPVPPPPPPPSLTELVYDNEGSMPTLPEVGDFVVLNDNPACCAVKVEEGDVITRETEAPFSFLRDPVFVNVEEEDVDEEI